MYQFTGNFLEVMLHETHHMEPIGQDFCVWKEASDQTAIRTAQIDTDHLYSIPAFESAKKGKEVLEGFARYDIEDTMPGKVTEGGGEALLFMEGALIDTKHPWAV